MDDARSDRLLKRVWLINGFLVLALAVVGLGALAFALVSAFWPAADAAVRVAGDDRPAEASIPRAVRYGAPVAVRGTRTLLVPVRHGEADQPQGASLDGGYASGRAKGYYYGQDGPIVNVAFLTPGQPEGRLLLDRPALVTDLSYPAVQARAGEEVPEVELPADSLRSWISYRIVDRDTNGDGKLSHDDRAGLFVSALDGTGLRRVLPERFRLVGHDPTDDGRNILVLALEPPQGDREVPEEQMRQRTFVYDVQAGALRPYAELEALADRAARIVGR